MKILTCRLLVVVLAVGCKSATETQKTASSGVPEKSERMILPDVGDGTTRRAPEKKKHIKNEFSSGQTRFKEPGVYVDGKLVGILRFEELPVPLEPFWHTEEAMEFVEMGKPKQKVVYTQRRYRVTTYLEALGVDLKKVKEVHIYGGLKRPMAKIVDGKSLLKHDNLMFRFGSSVFGKPIAACPKELGMGKCPDQMTTMLVYIDKTPPTVKDNKVYLNGKRITGIPYLGDPIRGGVRVYKDNRYVTSIKRRELTKYEEIAEISADGQKQYNFFALLTAQGIKVDDIQQLWLIHNGKRVYSSTGKQAANSVFLANKQKSGEVLWGDLKRPANVITLHTTPLKKSDFPVLREDEINQ